VAAAVRNTLRAVRWSMLETLRIDDWR
jgi:hypothetical protein